MKLKLLENNSVLHDSKRLKDKKLFRIRIGNYRVLYEIDYKNNFVGIVKIDKRGRVYKK